MMEIHEDIENVKLTSEKSMADKVKTLFEKIEKVCITHCKLNQHAMLIMQSLGYNGFKRWHRYRSKFFFDMKTYLVNELYDNYGIVSDMKEFTITYKPSSMEEHLRTWQSMLLDSIQTLGETQKEYFDTTGTDCEIINKLIHVLGKDHEKVKKFYNRFVESDWLTLDMHIVDDALHCKFKEKEEKHGHKK
jgi:hypothetical protein